MSIDLGMIWELYGFPLNVVMITNPLLQYAVFHVYRLDLS